MSSSSQAPTRPLPLVPLLPGSAMLGVLGGGQLGRMFVHAAQAHGYRVAVLEPDAASPAGAAADLHLCAPYTDSAALAHLQRACAAVTTEFENVPAGALRELAAALPVAPPADAVAICQHRALEKRCFVQAGVPCAPHWVIDSAADAGSAAAAALLPGILKTARLGYDGKGQAVVASRCRPACRLGRARWRPLRAGAAPAPAPRDQRRRRAWARRSVGAPSGAAEPAPGGHPGGHAGAAARHRRPDGGASRRAGRAAGRGAAIRRRAVRGILRAAGRLAGRQRDGAPAAQLRPLQHRRLRRLAVRPAGADAGRPAAWWHRGCTPRR